jgi:hypothetical protein
VTHATPTSNRRFVRSERSVPSPRELRPC